MGAFETRCKVPAGPVVHFAVKLSSRSTRHGSARLGFADVAAVADDEICGLVLANFQPAGETYGRSSNPVFIWEQKPRSHGA